MKNKTPLDKEIEEAQKEVLKPYLKAQTEIRKFIKAYFDKFSEEDNQKRQQVEAGEITEDEYKSWRLRTFCTGKEFKKFQKKLAQKYLELNQNAIETINKGKEKAFLTGVNYNFYLLEQKINGSKK